EVTVVCIVNVDPGPRSVIHLVRDVNQASALMHSYSCRHLNWSGQVVRNRAAADVGGIGIHDARTRDHGDKEVPVARARATAGFNGRTYLPGAGLRVSDKCRSAIRGEENLTAVTRRSNKSFASR